MKLQNKLNLQPTVNIKRQNTRFTEMFIEVNGLNQSGFKSWIFCPGMLFNSPDKWWGDHGQRDFPHEGIDLCLYRDHTNRMLRLDKKTQIPVICDGVVKTIFTDFLGKAVIIEHKDAGSDHGRFLSIYAHTKPRVGVQIGVMVREGNIIATLADTSKSKSNIIPHLHFSLGLPSPNLTYTAFIWNTIRKPDMITLWDPLGILDFPYQVLASENPYCHNL